MKKAIVYLLIFISGGLLLPLISGQMGASKRTFRPFRLGVE